MKEIWASVSSMGSFKAPGQDGFQALFYQKCWDLVRGSVCEMEMRVLQGQPLPEGPNRTYLMLIPKTENPHKPSQFRSISLYNVAYKIITKTIVQPLQGVLPELIAPTQASFVPGRTIWDNIVIMQELLHTMRKTKGKRACMAIKIDLEKTYDRLR